MKRSDINSFAGGGRLKPFSDKELPPFVELESTS